MCLLTCEVFVFHISTSGATATQPPHFGPGVGFIVMDNVNCNGNEANLTQCQRNGFGVHDCVPAEDAGVFCSAGKSVHWMISCDTQNCTHVLCTCAIKIMLFFQRD